MGMGDLAVTSRADWSAREPNYRKMFLVEPSERKGLVIHHNGPPLGIDVTATRNAIELHERRLLAGIQRFHMDNLGWSDTAYSWFVGQSGVIYEARGLTWNQFANGRDTVGEDEGSDREWYTVMWMGGGSETPTPKAYDAIRQLVRWVRGQGAGSAVRPHNAFKVKACPGPELTAYAYELNEWNPVEREEFEALVDRVDELDGAVDSLVFTDSETRQRLVDLQKRARDLQRRVAQVDARSREAKNLANSVLAQKIGSE